jgi:site-specific recombinase XerD
MLATIPLTKNSQLALKHRILTIEELQNLGIPFRLENGQVLFEKSVTGRSLRKPVTVPLASLQSLGEKGLAGYILRSFIHTRPTLIPFVLENASLIRMTQHFLRHNSGSMMSLYAYTNDVNMFSRFLDFSPDAIIQDAKSGTNIADAIKVQNHIGLLEQYLANLQDEGLSPGRVFEAIKHIRTFYRSNGVELKLQEPLSRRVTHKDRSPTPEELTHALEIADLGDATALTLLSLGGFRIDTLSKLEYKHIKHDFERGMTPIHVHVDVEITKGKYADYDTFLGGEATEFLGHYLDDRRKGSPDTRRPPENLTDSSPLIRDRTSHIPRGISAKQVRTRVHNLYVRSGLVKERKGRMYDVRVHSLRKYFKTQLVAAGVPESHADYMMGHVTDTYNNVQQLGVEKLRQIYANAALTIRPKTRVSKIEALKEMVRAMGWNPEQVLNREALTEPAATFVGSEQLQSHQEQVLRRTLRELIEATASGSNQLRGS